MRPMWGLMLLLFLAGIPGVAEGYVRSPHYRIIDFGPPAGATDITPEAINDHGTVIGYMLGADNLPHGFLWSRGRFTDLGVGRARQMNNCGEILLLQGDEAYLWKKGRLKPLDGLGGPGSHAEAINDLGMVAGTTFASYDISTWIWKDGRVRSFDQPWQLAAKQAVAVNNAGMLLGMGYTTEEEARIFVYGRRPAIIAPKDAEQVRPVALNNRGWVLGDAFPADETKGYAFLWHSGRFLRVGKRTKSESIIGVALNDRQQVIGHLLRYGDGDQARDVVRETYFLWQRGRVYPLLPLISHREGWSYMAPSAINNRGEIVGVGRYRGNERMFTLTPVNPGQ